MSNTVTVEVIDGHGRSIKGKRVAVFVHGILTGGELVEFTDDSGHAYFETAGDYASDRKITITVGGEEFGPYEIGGGSYTIRLD